MSKISLAEIPGKSQKMADLFGLKLSLRSCGIKVIKLIILLL